MFSMVRMMERLTQLWITKIKTECRLVLYTYDKYTYISFIVNSKIVDYNLFGTEIIRIHFPISI